MLDEFKKSVSLILYERITSPLSGAIFFSWFIWNWRIPYILFIAPNRDSLTKQIEFVEQHYLNIEHNIVLPLLSASFLVLVYPFASTAALYVWLQFRKWQNKLRHKIENSQLLTIEQSVNLRLQIQRLQDDISELVKGKDEEIQSLKEINQQLQSELIAIKNQPSLKTQPVRQKPLSDKAKELLIKVVASGDGNLNRQVTIKGEQFGFGKSTIPLYVHRDNVEWTAAAEELKNRGLFSGRNGNEYAVTAAGYKEADQLRGT